MIGIHFIFEYFILSTFIFTFTNSFEIQKKGFLIPIINSPIYILKHFYIFKREQVNEANTTSPIITSESEEGKTDLTS